jgi:2,3-dihydro-2,3-dihydroxybenzoate dehydrogenase
MGGYAASKAASAMLTRCLGLELAAHGIRCNTVSPGSTDTPMLRAMWQNGNGARDTIAGSLDHHRLGIPLGKLGQSEDVANAVAFLASDEASHITLQDLCVDGGASLGS